MSDIRKSSFWSDLVRKVLNILFKNAFGLKRKTHHQHVVPYEGEWAVRGEGNERVTAVYDTQAQAIDRAKEIAKNYRSSVIIHGENGAIRDRIHYD